MIFTTLFTNLLPLYAIIAIGFVAGRLFHLDRKALADLSLYVLMPVTVFGFIAQIDLKPEYALLPLISFGLQSIMGLSAFVLAKKIWSDSTPNLLAMCASMPNSGYFGLPLVVLLFDTHWAGVYTFFLLGGILYEATFGYYIAARGHFDARQSLQKLIRFPVLYALAAALALNLSGLAFNDQAVTYWGYFKGAYIVVGMMIIGTALAKMDRLEFGGGRFFGIVLAWKFALWPLTALTLVGFDRLVTGWLDQNLHSLILIFSILPPAANIAAFAAQLNLTPEKAATTVLFGTLFALLYIPAVFWIFGIEVG